MAINREAKQFLDTLGDGQYVFQTFSDKKADDTEEAKAEVKRAIRVLIGSPEEHGDLLSALNDNNTAGVFVQVNDGTARGAEHIHTVRVVFVDLDDPDTVEKSLQHIRKHMPEPSIMVQTSKKKFHLYWVVTNCELDDFEAIQTQLATTYNGDKSMKNLDRVMRIPGFFHQKGEPFKVKLVMANDNQYSIETIRKHLKGVKPLMVAPVPAVPKPGQVTDVMGLNINVQAPYEIPTTPFERGTRTVELTRIIGKLISELWGEGHIEEEVRRLNVELCPEGQEPLTDSQLEMEVLPAISRFKERQNAERDKLEGKKAERKEVKAEAKAQHKVDISQIPEPVIKRAPPPPDQPHTMENWLSRYILVSQGSRIIDSHKLGKYGEYTMSDFKNMHANVLIPYNNRSVALSSRWMQHRDRRTVRDTYYRPNAKQILDVGNHSMWNLYAPSEVRPTKRCDPTKIQPFIDHIDYMFPNPKHAAIFWCWMAMTIQHPEIRIPWAPLIISMQGVGKGFIHQVLAKILGEHNTEMILPDRLDSPFNPYMGNSTLVTVDEMKTSRNSNADKMKSLISEKYVEINEKGKPERTQEVFANFLIFTNHDNSAFIEQDDRRFWVYKVPCKKRDPKYYKQLWEWMEEPQALNNLHRYLMDYDLSNFSYATCPAMTEAKLHMIDSNKSQLELDIEDAITHSDDLFEADIIGYSVVKDWAEAKMGGVIAGKTEGLFRQIWGRLGVELPQFKGGIRASTGTSATRQRVRCIRNDIFWRGADTDEVKYEFTRSCQLATVQGRENSNPPMYRFLDGKPVKVVEGGKSEKSNRS